MASAPVFAGLPKRYGLAQVLTANTARDGSGALSTVLTAGASGTRIEKIRVVATGATTDGFVRLFVHDGTNARLEREVMVSAITPSATVKAFEVELDFSHRFFDLPLGFSLRASTHNGETFNVHAMGGDF